ncbi:ribosomal protein S1 [Allocatelliglobosispora scoriae]|uniref:Ribosomal protein S1 n=1 Tax=Allocatelliglobosispora scoriae TaxID=643052 RepID=A0A841BHL2_9ACTN|nr:RNA-binding protein [Allocatelliglobosispora scoriae]MBB5868587.1 ribosomal protein S1 [Allocatelliglobosispora scoriae]
MTTYSWPDRDAFDPNRLAQAWPMVTRDLPIGTHVRGEVVARQPFGVFVRIKGAPDALGLAEITAMPRDAVLPEIGTTMSGEVIWRAEHNHQIKLRLVCSATAGQHPKSTT